MPALTLLLQAKRRGSGAVIEEFMGPYATIVLSLG